MNSGSSLGVALNIGSHSMKHFLWRQASRLAGFAMVAFVAFAIVSLSTWNVADPSFSYATSVPVQNAMGYPGAVYADIVLQFFGIAAVATLVPAVLWAFFLITGRYIDRKPLRAAAWLGGSILAAGIAGCIAPPPTWPLPMGLGGVFGDFLLQIPALFTGDYPSGLAGFVVAAVLAAPALFLTIFGSGVIARRAYEDVSDAPFDVSDEDDDGDESRSAVVLGILGHWWLSGLAFLRRHSPRRAERETQYDDDFESMQEEFDAPARYEAHSRNEPGMDDYAPRESRDAYFEDDDDADLDFPITPVQPAQRERQNDHVASLQQSMRPQVGGPARVEAPAERPQPAPRVSRTVQHAPSGRGGFTLPSLRLLAPPKVCEKDPSLSKEALEQNARLLEGVLDDFGVKGEIIQVRPGPVVTLYELEPAPGIKSSRVIGLADDIARSMSAIACRVAVVPGRNAIGIELPNTRRETVYLREILASKDFEHSKHKLALALGKSINGEVVTVDIAKMPHVLVAGTTGSGKSVAINTMILSLVYRMTPDNCRLIMIDPKMVELSVYDGIPHLLTPVVTEPKKAVVALKWTVREMEDRYRKMAKLGVRNQEGFNARVAEAKAKGELITRTVQTGFDRQTGEAIYESEELDLEPMPFIVVIIDEVADLMMVAGKDIEGAVQRLGQMARAAGIHVIMATQRPSVDVITGTIKANFPTRMSFQVTSKIDSRTILGEQGAEQLLGMGDMLYMAGGGRIQRVHGPFVSDQEVEQIVQYLKTQGVPDYLDAITADDDEDGADSSGSGGGSGSAGNLADSDDPYDQAVAVVLRDGKVSTSYIQRRLGIGYNRAASIIERMEQEGVISAANHAGKREILVPTERDND